MILEQVLSRLLKSQFGKNSAIYILSSLAAAMFSFLLVSLFTQYLSKEDFGYIETFLTCNALFVPILLWGNEVRLVDYYTKDSDKSMYLTATIGIICQFVLLLIASFVFLIFKLEVSFSIFICSVFFSFFTAYYKLISSSYQLESNPMAYAIISVGLNLLTFGFSLSVLFFIGDYWSRILGSIIAILIVVGFSFKRFSISKLCAVSSVNIPTEIAKFYKKGSFLFTSQFASWAIERVDRLQILSLLSLERLGIYAIGAQFGLGANVLGTALSRAWLPHLLKLIEADNKRKIIIDIIGLSIGLLLSIVALSITIYFYFVYFIDDEFRESAGIAIMISVGYFFDGVWKLFNGIIIVEKKYKYYSKLLIVCSIVKLALNFILISKFNLLGTAITNIVVFALGAIMSIIYVFKYLNWFKQNEKENGLY